MLLTDTIVIHGGGYVGLTAAVHYASQIQWKKVWIYDLDENVVGDINEGRPRGEEFLGYLNARVASLVKDGKIEATTDWNKISGEFYHSLAVPTEKNDKPYGAIVCHSLEKLFCTVPPGAVIIIESTLAPGMIDDILKERPGYVHVAVCPRRDWFASEDKNLSNLDRVVGGIDKASTEKAIEVIKTVTRYGLIHRTDRETAEICKALENALLHAPVMFAHQLAEMLPDKNVREALRLAGTHWRLPQYFIGFGTGGRCVPLGTQYLLNASVHSRHHFHIAQEVMKEEESIRLRIAQIAFDYLEKRRGGNVLVLGAGYRPNFKDIGGSPGIHIAKKLFQSSFGLPLKIDIADYIWDPKELKQHTGGVNCVGNFKLEDYDVILLATCHDRYRDLPLMLVLKRGQLIIDAQGSWDHARKAFEIAGVDYRVVGEPNWTGKEE